MREEDDAEQRRHVARAEYLADDARGQRYCGQPQDSHGEGKSVDRQLRFWQQQKGRDDDCAREIDRSKARLLAVALADDA